MALIAGEFTCKLIGSKLVTMHRFRGRPTYEYVATCSAFCFMNVCEREQYEYFELFATNALNADCVMYEI